MVSINVILFANLKELAGVKKFNLTIPDQTTISELKQIISEKYPGISQVLNASIVAVNHEYSQEAYTLKNEDEIAIFPPVSGGMVDDISKDIYLITENQLDINDLLSSITQSSTGAICLFTGVVRGLTQRGRVHETSYLEYEAYTPMAESKMRQVANEIRNKWPSIETIAIIQRIGTLLPGTPTILIACSAGHRDTGIFEAARYGIDRLKEIVPIWKKEVNSQGESWVEGDYYPKPGE